MTRPEQAMPSSSDTVVMGRSLKQHGWLALLAGYMLTLIVLGLFIEPSRTIWFGLLDILQNPGLLLSDYLAVGGAGAALTNAGLVGLSGLALVYTNGVLLSGPTIAALFTMAGFGLFGKNAWSIWIFYWMSGSPPKDGPSSSTGTRWRHVWQKERSARRTWRGSPCRRKKSLAAGRA